MIKEGHTHLENLLIRFVSLNSVLEFAEKNENSGVKNLGVLKFEGNIAVVFRNVISLTFSFSPYPIKVSPHLESYS